MSTRLNNLINSTNATVVRLTRDREVLLNRLARLQVKLTSARALQARYRKRLYSNEAVPTTMTPDELADWNGVRVRSKSTAIGKPVADDPIDDLYRSETK